MFAFAMRHGAIQEMGQHQEIDVGGVAEALTSASKVVIVPGYGMAVANAQYPVAELAKSLSDKGVQVRLQRESTSALLHG